MAPLSREPPLPPPFNHCSSLPPHFKVTTSSHHTLQLYCSCTETTTMTVPPPPPPPHTLGLLFILLLSAVAAAEARGDGSVTNHGVTYDGRSLIINGRRELVFSGSIHYPRSTPEMWPALIRSAKLGGLNAIETYVFWNIHEPEQGKYNFEGNNDIVNFLKLVKKNGMFAILRLGPFIQAEWNHGGLPYWLREVPNILFRTENEPFMSHMQKFVSHVIQIVKNENLFAPQGGPIILAQIENEYNNIARAYKDAGVRYIKWAAEMAVSLDVGVPWVMCKQNDAPGPVINACNGRNCGDTFVGPNHPNKPALWTENWTAQYRVFGDPPSQRSAEDISYAVSRFFSKNGTLTNYYMYHGGTNLGRNGASFMTTRYYDEAPLDEFGLMKEPKWGHLKDLHHALRLCRKALLWGDYSVENFGQGFEARLYQQPENNICVAFLTNTNKRQDGSVTFRGTEYYLPRRSISILGDCKTVIYNTQKVNAQHNSRNFDVAPNSAQNNNWEMYTEHVPKLKEAKIRNYEPLELYNMTKDITDYLWYTTSFKADSEDLPRRTDIRPVIAITSFGHALHVFVNGKFIGSGHGTKIEKSFVFQQPMPLREGVNNIAILCLTTGMTDSGAYLEHRMAGVYMVSIQGLNTGTLDLTSSIWGHIVGLDGEKKELFTEQRAGAVKWTTSKPDMPVAWYKRYFEAPHGTDPVALDMSSMGKGLVWVNGNCVGRYWVSYHSPLGKPSQSMYHVPRSFLKPSGNFMVVFEEHGGKPEDIGIMTVTRDNICAFVSDSHPGNVKSWSREDNKLRSVIEDVRPAARLKCFGKKTIRSVVFASFGNPDGMCGSFTEGTCHTPQAKAIVEKACLGKKACTLPVTAEAYGADTSCQGTTGTLAVQVKCSRGGE